MTGSHAAPNVRSIALVAACPFPSPQGSQVFVGQMASRLAAAGHRVHLVTYGQGARVTDGGYEHHRVARFPGDDSGRSGPNFAKPVLDAMLAIKLAAVVRRERIGIVHAHNYEAALAALAVRRLTGAPVVYHSHNLMGDELETYFASGLSRRIASRAGELLDRNVPRRADRTIALCEWSAAELRRRGCRADALAVIPPAIDDDGAIVARDDDRRRFGLDAEDFVVGYSGNLDAYQNLALLLEAVLRLRAASPPQGPGRLRLLVATHGDARGFATTPAARRLGDTLRTAVVGSHDEARRAIAASDILALPRRLGSGYPVKLLNYMSAAKALVVAGCGSKMLRNGVDGIIVADDDPDALSDAIDRCRRDPGWRRALGDAARRTFLERLTWEHVLPQIEAVYDGLREPARAVTGP